MTSVTARAIPEGTGPRQGRVAEVSASVGKYRALSGDRRGIVGRHCAVHGRGTGTNRVAQTVDDEWTPDGTVRVGFECRFDPDGTSSVLRQHRRNDPAHGGS